LQEFHTQVFQQYLKFEAGLILALSKYPFGWYCRTLQEGKLTDPAGKMVEIEK